ncbi:MAG: histidine phosphatase family protein [Propionibacteriaceae bacterium]|nr:histidine phosphatase family protein [Propionibacteriaceae bacterium]
MRILFIRHGQTASNVGHQLDTGFPGAPLSPTGLAQADTLPERLREEPIEVVMTSDLTRARQTGEPLAKSKGVPLITNPGVREIFAGDWDMSVDWQDYVNIIASWQNPSNLDRGMPHGDTGHSFFRRYDAAVGEMVGYGCAAIVSHGGALRTWLGVRGDLELDRDPTAVLSNTAVVTVEGEPGDWRILDWAGHQIR